MQITDALLDSLRMVESGGDPRAVSPAGAQGPYQFMPATAKQFGIDPFNEQQSREAARKYLVQLAGQFGSVEDALRAYNWGPGNMAAYRKTGLGAKGQPMPQETQAYVGKVMKQQPEGRDLSEELFAPQGRDLSGELFGEPAKSAGPAGGVKGVVGGVLRGIRDPIDGGAQLLARGVEALIPDSMTGLDQWAKGEVARVEGINKAAERDYRDNWRGGQDPGFDVSRMAGNVVASLPLAAGSVPATLGGKVAQSAAAGAGFGAINPVTEGDFWTEKAKQVGAGAAAGAVAAPIMSGIARVVSPKSSQAVQALRKEGVTPTPGQVLGGAWKAGEEKLSSVPLLGDAIKAGQRRAVRELNEVAINRTLAPIGVKVPKGMIGREAIEYADDAIGKVYQRATDRMGAVPVDGRLLDDLGNLQSLLANQPKELAERLGKLIDNEVLSRTEYGRMTGEAIRKAESNLGREARGWMASQDYDTRVLGQAAAEAQRSLRQWMQRVAPKGVADDIRNANAAWAQFKRVQRASGMLGAEDGVFSGAQLQNAVKAMDRSKDKARFATGKALMQDLSEPAKDVLSQTIPDSGTAGRTLAALLAGGIGYVSPASLAAGALPALAYTPSGQRTLAALLAGRQGAAFKAASQGLMTLTPALGAALAPAGYGLANK